MRQLSVAVDIFPVRGHFSIARGSRTEAVVVAVTVVDGPAVGRGECVPYARYGETVEGVIAAIEGLRAEVEAGLDRMALQNRLPAGAARNALDCALFDLEAKRTGRSAAAVAGIDPAPSVTAFTISLAEPEAMAAAAGAARDRALLKVKLGGPGDPERIAAVRRAAPGARLIVDANEAWTPADLAGNLAACRDAGVELVEQPLPAGGDAALDGIDRLIPLCADESLHDRASLAALRGRYDAINVKLDKTGGLTEALALVGAARAAGLEIMVGCMLASSLAMAPATLLAGFARWVDLDGPLLLAADRPYGLDYTGGLVHPPRPELWG